MPLKKTTRFTGQTSAVVIGLVMVAVAAAAMVLAARPSSQPEETIAPVAQSQTADASPAPKKATPKVQPKKTMPAKTTASMTTAPKAASTTTAPKTTAAVPAPLTAGTIAPVATAGAPAAASASKSAAQDKSAAQETATAATITGCVEKHGDDFRLKNTTGLDAPKSRSWKSGFLKKGSSTIDLVDEANRVKLASHVGQRVTVTGMLEDRELQVRSLQRVADSCN